MGDDLDNYAAARKLEDIKLFQDISDMTPKREAEIKAMEHKLASQGLAHSGARFLSEINIMFDSTQEVIDKAIARRKELAGKVPALLESANIAAFENKLCEIIDGTYNGVKTRLTLNPRSAGGGSVIRQAEQRAYAMRAKLRSALAALPLEVKLGMNEKGASAAPAITISNSMVGNLNLGTVIGNLNSSIRQLTVEGHKDLGAALSKLSEAILISDELGDSAKKELLEHAAFVSGEMTLPEEQRKMAPVRTSIEMLKSGVLVASQLVTLWQGVEKALQMMGVLPPSS